MDYPAPTKPVLSHLLRRRLGFVAGLLLVACTVFLNYRPRYPTTFTTRYDTIPPRQQMIDDICRLRGEKVRGQLRMVETSSDFPYCGATLRLAHTGEEFRVFGPATIIWELGRYQPRVDVPAAPTEDFHRAFMRRFHRRIPVHQMQLMNPSVRMRRKYTFTEVTPHNLIVSANRCVFSWDESGKRLQQVIIGYAPPLPGSVAPTLSRAEAERLALRRAFRKHGLAHARITNSSVPWGPEYRDVPTFEGDLGVGRCVYGVEIADLKWRSGSEPTSDSEVEQPKGGFFLVDACTGAVVPIFGAFVERGLLRQRLDPLAHAGQWFVAYPAVRLWGVPYVCGKYLQSDLWCGRYNFDPRSGVFTVEDQGLKWTGRRGSPFLRGPEGLSMSWVPPRMVDRELYLPMQMIHRITGWTASGGWSWLKLQPPSRRVPQIVQEAKSQP